MKVVKKAIEWTKKASMMASDNASTARAEVKHLFKELDVSEFVVVDFVSPVRNEEGQAVNAAICESEEKDIPKALLNEMEKLADESLPGTPVIDSEASAEDVDSNVVVD